MGLGNMLVLSQVTGYTLTFILAFFIFVPLAVNKAEFKDHCLLYASGKWVTNSTGEFIDVTNWGSVDSCNFPIFVAVVSLPVSLAYCALLAVDLFKNTEPSWLSAFVCALITFIAWFMTLVASCTVTVGYNKWCSLVHEQFSNCRMMQFGEVKTDLGISFSAFADQFGLAKFGLWLSWICWTALVALASIQLYKYHNNESIFISVRRERERLLQRTAGTPDSFTV